MLNKISKASTKVLLDKNIIEQPKENIYIYGFEVIYSTLFGFISIFFLGIIFGRIKETLVFLLYFTIMRQAVGGYHAATYKNCFLISNLVFVLENVLSTLLIEYSEVIWGIFIFSMVYMYLKAPSPNIHRKKTEKKREESRKRAVWCLFVCFLSMILFSILNLKVVMSVVDATMAIVAGMIYINEKGGL